MNLSRRARHALLTASFFLVSAASSALAQPDSRYRSFTGPCSQNSACLQHDWFEVSVRFHDPKTATWKDAGLSGVDIGHEAVLVHFFSSTNIEMLVKVLDGQSLNNRFWVFAAAATDLGFQLKVRDTRTGWTNEYHNTPGDRPLAITDNFAFVHDGRLPPAGGDPDGGDGGDGGGSDGGDDGGDSGDGGNGGGSDGGDDSGDGGDGGGSDGGDDGGDSGDGGNGGGSGGGGDGDDSGDGDTGGGSGGGDDGGDSGNGGNGGGSDGGDDDDDDGGNGGNDGGDDPEPPVTLSGEWSGAVTHNFLGAGTLQFSATMVGNKIVGTFRYTYPGVGSLSGSLVGEVSGNSFYAQLTPSRSDVCDGFASGTFGSDWARGQWNSVRCLVNEHGTFSLVRQ